MTHRSRTSLLHLFLIGAVLLPSAMCNLFPPAGAPLPLGVTVRLINRTGEMVQVEVAFLNQGVEIRRTKVRLNPTGPGVTTDILPTQADTFNTLAVDASTVPPNGQGGVPLILRQFHLGVDFELGEIFEVSIFPLGEDCNDNGKPDVADIVDGDSVDCNADGVPDECQADTDGDGLIDPCDGCPSDAAKNAPGACGCNAADADTDGDGTPDCSDGCPNDPLKTKPDSCGCGVSESDGDHDGVPDCVDGCPGDPNKQAPGACGCGVAETDQDADGTPDCADGCPEDPQKIAPGQCGCGVSEVDFDGDGTPDCLDGCPGDPQKTAPGVCGCGVADSDGDEDGTPDCNDGCPQDPAKIAPGTCGCGVADVDSDQDGVLDCLDGCPLDPYKVAPGACGCGIADIDSDEDGTPDCLDGCPQDPYKIAPGVCGCGNPELIGDEDEDGVPDCLDTCPGGDDTVDCDANGVPDFCDRILYWSQLGPVDALIVRKLPTYQPCTTQPVAVNENHPSEMDVDAVGGKVYWLATDGESQIIRRCDLDGDDLETLPLEIQFPRGIAIDAPARTLYWIEQPTMPVPIVTVWAVNLEDPQLQQCIVYEDAGDDPYGLAVDPVLRVATWGQHNAVTYLPELAKLDLASPEPVAEILYVPVAFNHELLGTAIDGSAQKVYWVERITTVAPGPEGESLVRSEIRRMNLDGNPNTMETIVGLDAYFIRDLALDSAAGRIYWTVATPRMVMGSDLDGGNVQTIHAFTTRYLLNGLALRIP